MSTIYDPLGHREALIADAQNQFERWQWHVEDERILPVPVLAGSRLVAESAHKNARSSNQCCDEAQASNESRLSQLNGQTLAAGNSLYETTVQSPKDIAAALPGPDHDEAPADSRRVP